MQSNYLSNHKIHAQVINIKADTPKEEDKFLVDTNVWYWLQYNRFSNSNISRSSKSKPPKEYQLIEYPEYLKKIKRTKASLFYCGLSLAELAHSIEKWEKELFAFRNKLEKLELKEYRRNYPAQRSNVVRKVQNAWKRVKDKADCLDFKIDEATTGSVFTNLETQLLDGHDLFLVEAMKNANVDKIITDDSDFLYVPDITVFTAYDPAIDAAREQGKLVFRKR